LEGSFDEEDNEAEELYEKERRPRRHRSRGVYGDRFVPPFMHHPF
jgi:hypothetical protein